ncbi:MAG: DUF721 domain-containing protein [Oligoflexia bacterium]|nr:DUF721 domain-containing protein [Oligoflexia bacterium]
MKKNKNFSTPIEVLEKLLGDKKGHLSSDFKRFQLKSQWADIMGATIASKTSPISYKNKILFVWVESSSWMNQLFYARKEMAAKINQVMGAGWVKDIRFTLDHKSVLEEQESK